VALALLSSTLMGLKSAWADSVFHAFDSGNGLNHISVNPNNNGIHSTDFFSNAVSAMDHASNKIVNTKGIGDSPVSIAFSPSNKDVRVANPSSEPVYVIDRCYDKVIHTLIFHIDCTPFSSAFNPSNNGIHVSDAFSNSVFIIDSFSNKVIVTIGTGNLPHSIALNPTNYDMYVTNFGVNKIPVMAATSAPIQQNVHKQQ
jgi:YVTN family beta-propeller protein